MGIIFEYTAPGTPQQNGVVERVFVKVMGRARAMMNHSGFTMAKRQQLWCEALQTVTLLNDILVQGDIRTRGMLEDVLVTQQTNRRTEDSAKSPPFTQCFGVDAKSPNI